MDDIASAVLLEALVHYVLPAAVVVGFAIWSFMLWRRRRVPTFKCMACGTLSYEPNPTSHKFDPQSTCNGEWEAWSQCAPPYVTRKD